MTTPWIIAFCVLVAVVVVEALALIGVQGRVSAAIARVEGFLSTADLDERFRGLDAGVLAPAIPARRVAGPPVRLQEGSATLLVFTEAGCDPCDALVRDIQSHPEPLPGVRGVFVTSSTARHDIPSLPEHWTVLTQEDRQASLAYQVTAVPYAYVIDESGKIVAGKIPNSVNDLIKLCSQYAADELSYALSTVATNLITPTRRRESDDVQS